MTYHKELQCDVDKVEYYPRACVGRVYCVGCTDMDGCIEFFQKIDRKVKRIETFRDRDQDTTYVRTATGWKAIPS